MKDSPTLCVNMVKATEEAATVLARAGALIRDVNFPSPDDVARVSILLCGLETAAAHEATFPSRASEYGPVLAGLLESARAFDALAMAEIVLCREAFRVASVPTRHGPSPMPPSTAAAPDAGSRIVAPPEPTMRGTSNRSDTGSPVEADRGNGAVAPFRDIPA
jgi:hypothetical protein